MSPDIEAMAMRAHGFPRVSGDEPEAVQGQGLVGEFSPRERG